MMIVHGVCTFTDTMMFGQVTVHVFTQASTFVQVQHDELLWHQRRGPMQQC